MAGVTRVTLRMLEDADLELLFAWEQDTDAVGMIAGFTIEGDRELTYWIDPARWGRGLASAALDAFVQVETTRPLFARVAEHNVGSATVLTRAGFVRIGTETSYADAVGREVVEHIYRLDGSVAGP